jgi:NCS1 family nucleobase:cation symporter-1
MGVKAPQEIQRFYYIAYPTGLFIGFGAYYLICLASPPEGMKEVSGWMEPKDFVEEHDGSGLGSGSGSEGYAIDAVEPEKGAIEVSKEADDKNSF